MKMTRMRKMRCTNPQTWTTKTSPRRRTQSTRRPPRMTQTPPRRSWGPARSRARTGQTWRRRRRRRTSIGVSSETTTMPPPTIKVKAPLPRVSTRVLTPPPPPPSTNLPPLLLTTRALPLRLITRAPTSLLANPPPHRNTRVAAARTNPRAKVPRPITSRVPHRPITSPRARVPRPITRAPALAPPTTRAPPPAPTSLRARVPAVTRAVTTTRSDRVRMTIVTIPRRKSPRNERTCESCCAFIGSCIADLWPEIVFIPEKLCEQFEFPCHRDCNLPSCKMFYL